MYYLKPGVSLETQYKDILSTIINNGSRRHVRGFNTLELSPFVWVTNLPLRNILTNQERKINRAFSVAEFLWLISGRNDTEMISFYNSKILNYSDNYNFMAGAYGPKIQQQIKYIIDILTIDKFSRQAVMTIWERNPLLSKDIPCTIMMQFLINEFGKLDLIVYMRSNDAWLGFPYDVYNFTMIQNYLSFLLKTEVGTYTHISGSEHLYESCYDKAKNACISPVLMNDIEQSEQITKDELMTTLNIEKKIRNGEEFDKKIIEKLTQPWQNMCFELLKKRKNNCVQIK